MCRMALDLQRLMVQAYSQALRRLDPSTPRKKGELRLPMRRHLHRCNFLWGQEAHHLLPVLDEDIRKAVDLIRKSHQLRHYHHTVGIKCWCNATILSWTCQFSFSRFPPKQRLEEQGILERQ